MQDGLSQSVILDIVQDSTGFLWIATQDGLNRYDGNEFKVFKYSPTDSNSIKGNWINTLTLGNNSTLWIGTYRSGLGKLNLKTYKYTHVLPDTSSSKKKFAIGKIIPFNNFLFVSTYGNGFYIINLQTNQIKRFLHNPKDSNSPSGNFIRSMLLSKNNVLWLGTTKGLDRFDIKKEIFTHYFKNDKNKKLAENFIVTLLEDSNNNLWIGTRKGLNIYNQITKQLFEYSNSPKIKNSLSDKTIIDFWEDSYGYVWIATWKGGLNKTKIPISSSVFNYKKIEFISFQKEAGNNFSLSGNYVRKIFEDKSKNLWIGTWGSSLNKIDLKPQKFHSVGSNKKDKLHLSNNFVRSFTMDVNGRLWVGTDGGGLDILDTKKNNFENHSFGYKKNKNLGKDRIYSLLTISNNDIWIGLGDGLVIWHSKENKFQNIEIKKYFPEIKRNILINGIVEYENEIILSSNFGLLVYTKKTNKFSKLYFPEKYKSIFPDKEISFILKEDKNNLWVGTNKSFLFKILLTKNDGSLFPKNIVSFLNRIPKNYFGSKRVNHLCKDKKGSVWISTSQGLFELTSNDSINIFTEKDGLPNEIIYASLEDNLGNIWVSTNKGIAKLSFNDGKTFIKNYDASDGLQGNEFNQASCYKSSKDVLYFGGINGYSYFKPKELKENPFPPNSVITQINILNKEIPNHNKVISNKALTVNYYDKMLTFSFAALEFTNPSKNKYAYKLEGFDDIWIYTENKRHATYTNLNPGNYKLKLKTSNDDEIWGKETHVLSLTVQPPFWMTWWFILLSLISIALLLFLIHKYRVKRLLEMERLRIKIASDLHDEVGPLLTQISLTADSINYDSDMSRIKKRSTTIRDRSCEIRNSLSDVIWTIDARKDKFENLIDRMHDFSNSLVEEKDIKLKFISNISDMNKILKVDFRQNIFLIFKEAVNNAVKHSLGSQITINIAYKKNEFIMKISDNGIGLDTEKNYKGNGLKNIKMRAEKISAQIEFFNNNGFTILLKTNYV